MIQFFIRIFQAIAGAFFGPCSHSKDRYDENNR